MLRQILGRAALAAAAFAAVVIVLAAILGAAAAHAAVYKLENPVYPVGVDYAAHASGDPAIAFGTVPFTLTVSPAAVQRGSFNLETGHGRLATGNVSDFIGFSSYDTITGLTFNVVDLRIALAFDATGSVTSGSLRYITDLAELDMSGSAQDFAGTFILGANSSYRGPISGQLLDPPDTVPEPSSLVLFLTTAAAALLGHAAKALAIKLT